MERTLEFTPIICRLAIASSYVYMKSLKCKNRYINFYQFEIFASIKATKTREIIRKYIFLYHYFKNIPCYVTSAV